MVGVLAATASAHAQAGASTWVFLGVFALLTAGMLTGWAHAIRQWQPPAWREDLVSAPRYYEVHGHHDEIDLGRQWRSTDDPGAYWHVWWVPDTGELIGVRVSAQPPPTVRYAYGGFRGHSWGSDPKPGIGGVKMLGTFLGLDRHLTDHLRLRPDGLDQLCGGTGSRGHLVAG